MVADNTDRHGTAFTVSVDLKGHGNTTGISAHDRARTIQALINPATRPEDLSRPGHIFPLIAKENGVLRRTGHTEAAIDFARLAGCEPAGVIVEIMNEDGSMARLPELRQIANRHGLKLVSIEALVQYRLQRESLIQRELEVPIQTVYGTFRFIVFTSQSGHDTQHHIAIVQGEWAESEPVLVRMNASTFSGDLFTSFLTSRNNALRPVLNRIAEEGKGVVIYMNQNHPAGGVMQNLLSFQMQEQGLPKEEMLQRLGIRKDERDFGIGAQILRNLGVRKMRLFSNHPSPKAALAGYGLEMVEVLPITD
jgi:3,4-dihydroxy 2-butanone 4-phosphate synthase/GTP cyclohydrolase II